MFPANKKHVSTSRNKGLAEKWDPFKGKNALARKQLTAIWENGIKLLPLASESVSIT